MAFAFVLALFLTAIFFAGFVFEKIDQVQSAKESKNKNLKEEMESQFENEDLSEVKLGSERSSTESSDLIRSESSEDENNRIVPRHRIGDRTHFPINTRFDYPLCHEDRVSGE